MVLFEQQSLANFHQLIVYALGYSLLLNSALTWAAVAHVRAVLFGGFSARRHTKDSARS
jgi:hypothetical protein